jgi:hypothetical protein
MLLIAFIIFWGAIYHFIGEKEYGGGMLLLTVSIMLACVTFFVFGWGFILGAVAQIGISGVLLLFKLFKKEPPPAL